MSEGSWLPKTWTEALPQVFWGVLILGFGLEFCVSILDANYGRALLAIVGLVALLAMLIHQEQLKQRLMTVNPNWIAGAFVLFLATIILSPFVEEKRWPFSAWFHAPSNTDQAANTAALAAFQAQLATVTQERDAARRELDMARKSPSIQQLAGERLGDLSNEQLANYAMQFVDELRKFEARFQIADRQLSDQEWASQLPIANEDARKKAWTDDRGADSRRRDQHNGEYDVRFRKPVLLYKQEICTRLEFTSPCPSNAPAVGMIESGGVGAIFVGMIADYLTLITVKLEQ